MELLARYLERGDRAWSRSCARPATRPRRRALDAVLANLYGERAPRCHRPRVQAFAADLTAPGARGSTPRVRDALAGRVTTIVHSAASVSFTLPLEEARAINVEGTRRMLEFADAARACGGLDRYGHVSTAYVAGHPRRALRRVRPRSRPGLPQLLRALEVRGRAARPLARRACRSRSCARASSSAIGAAAGRRRSTSSTGRCGRSRAACSRPCRRSRRRPSTSSRSTTWPTRSTSCASPRGRSARPTT